jgi:DNA-binding MarR family transcriptional regulator
MDHETMTPDVTLPKPELCNCLALRQAARHVTQFYDRFLAPAGLRTTQFSILAKLKHQGSLTINALATELVMDRTTLGRNILPLERAGLIAVVPGATDRRRKELHLTEAGTAALRAGVDGWAEAQRQFERRFGRQRTTELRSLLHAVATSELEPDFGGDAD